MDVCGVNTRTPALWIDVCGVNKMCGNVGCLHGKKKSFVEVCVIKKKLYGGPLRLLLTKHDLMKACGRSMPGLSIDVCYDI